MAGITDLYQCAQELLIACEQAVAFTDAGPINRCFVSAGLPAWDEVPQLTVHLGGPAQSDTLPVAPPLQPGHRLQETGSVNLVTLTATVLRCAPTMVEQGGLAGFPSPAELDASAAETLADCWAIWNHVATLKRSGVLYPPNTRELFFDPAVSVNTQGGVAGWALQFRVQLGGFKTT